jgi:hypothetical protein
VTNASFFSNLKRKNQKRTFINVLFPKIQNTFEKNDSLHSLRRPPCLYSPEVCDLYALADTMRISRTKTIMLRIIANDRKADALALL